MNTRQLTLALFLFGGAASVTGGIVRQPEVCEVGASRCRNNLLQLVAQPQPLGASVAEGSDVGGDGHRGSGLAAPIDFGGLGLSGTCWFTKDKEVPIGVHINASCPAECPFSQRLSGQHCWKACVHASGCSIVHPTRLFANPATLECEPACAADPKRHITGCIKCAGRDRCAACLTMYRPSPGGTSCESILRHWWTAAFYALSASGLFGMLYLLRLALKPFSSDGYDAEFLRRSLEHRERCRPHAPGTESWSLLPLMTTRACEQDISGLGVALYFRWLLFLALVSALLFVGTAGAYFVPLVVPVGDGWPQRHLRSDAQGCPVLLQDEPEPVLAAVSPAAPSVAGGSHHHYGPLLVQWRARFRVKGRFLHGSLSPRISSARISRGAGPKISKGSRRSHVREEDEEMRSHGMVGAHKMTRSVERAGKDLEDGEEYFPPAGDLNAYPHRMLAAITTLYVLITAISLHFSAKQWLFAVQWSESRPLHHRYAVRVDGLPYTATDPDDLRHFFQSLVDSASPVCPEVLPEPHVVGVSIAYSVSGKVLPLQQATDGLFEDLASFEPNAGKVEVADTWFSLRFLLRRHGLSGTLDRLFLPPSLPRVQDDDLRSLLRNLDSSGVAVVVLSSEVAVDQLLSLHQPRFHDGEELLLRRLSSEPPDIIWSNGSKRGEGRRVAKGVVTFLVALALFMALYVPYAVHYTLMVQSSAGGDTLTQDLVLGMLIAFGNQMLARVAQHVVGSFVFLEKARQDVVLLALVFFGSFVNTACDLVVIIYISKGATFENLLYGEVVHDGYDHVVARGLGHLLIPGYVLLPYILAPIWENVMPYFFQKWLLVERRDVSLSDAERSIELPMFDICWRYADILNIFTICLFMVLFTTPRAHQVMGWLLVFALLIFAIDRHRLLRHTSQTFFTTEVLSTAFSYLWALPTACLAGAVAWWAAEAGALPLTAWAAFCVAVPIHGFLYCAALRRLHTRVSTFSCSSSMSSPMPAKAKQRATAEGGSGVPILYGEACERAWREGQAYTYFSTNVAQVLRSRLLREEATTPRPECGLAGSTFLPQEAIGPDIRVPHARGKVHLQMGPLMGEEKRKY